jgi:hypothetical protein
MQTIAPDGFAHDRAGPFAPQPGPGRELPR